MDDHALRALLDRDPAAGTQAVLDRYGPLLGYVVRGILRDPQGRGGLPLRHLPGSVAKSGPIRPGAGQHEGLAHRPGPEHSPEPLDSAAAAGGASGGDGTGARPLGQRRSAKSCGRSGRSSSAPPWTACRTGTGSCSTGSTTTCSPPPRSRRSWACRSGQRRAGCTGCGRDCGGSWEVTVMTDWKDFDDALRDAVPTSLPRRTPFRR